MSHESSGNTKKKKLKLRKQRAEKTVEQSTTSEMGEMIHDNKNKERMGKTKKKKEEFKTQ